MEKTFIVKVRNSIYSIPLDQIVYFENERRKVHVCTIDGEYQMYATFREVLGELDERFLHCSRSYILNKDHIRAMRQKGEYEVIMDNGKLIPLSKKVFLPARRELEIWLRRKLNEMEKKHG